MDELVLGELIQGINLPRCEIGDVSGSIGELSAWNRTGEFVAAITTKT